MPAAGGSSALGFEGADVDVDVVARRGRVTAEERRLALWGPPEAEAAELVGRDLRNRPRSVQRYEAVGVATSKKPGATPVTMPSSGCRRLPAGSVSPGAPCGSAAEVGGSDVVRIGASRQCLPYGDMAISQADARSLRVQRIAGWAPTSSCDLKPCPSSQRRSVSYQPLVADVVVSAPGGPKSRG